MFPQVGRAASAPPGVHSANTPFPAPAAGPQGDAGALPRSLRSYAPEGQIKLLLLKLRVKKCKILFPLLRGDILFSPPSPLRAGRAVRASPTPVPVQMRGARRENLSRNLCCSPARAGAAPAPPVAGGLYTPFSQGEQPQQVAAVAQIMRWGAQPQQIHPPAIQAVRSRAALDVILFPKKQARSWGRKILCWGFGGLFFLVNEGRKKPKAHVSSVPLC